MQYIAMQVRILNTVLGEIDQIVQDYGGKVIKSVHNKILIAVGLDAIMGTSCAETCVQIATQIIQSLPELIKGCGSISAKAGVQTGNVSAGLIGELKFVYGENIPPKVGLIKAELFLKDIYGDTVNTASRMVSLAAPNSIFLTTSGMNALIESRSKLNYAGNMAVKGKGSIPIWRLDVIQDNSVKTLAPPGSSLGPQTGVQRTPSRNHLRFVRPSLPM
ncbi:hypothetical protein HDU76_010894, partial [Blyttiomyces sp. JEL0837]